MDLSVAMDRSRSSRNQGNPDPQHSDKYAFQLIMACARGDLAAVQRLVETERVPVCVADYDHTSESCFTLRQQPATPTTTRAASGVGK